MAILVTGGLGYIGSHVCIELVESGYEVVVIDNLCNSSIEVLKRIEKLANCTIPFYANDVRDEESLKRLFSQHLINAVIHLAGLKAIGESIEKPFKYYDYNVIGTMCLLRVMREFDCKTFVFSSSATVYGTPDTVPINENFPLSSHNPYGRSKLIIEDFLRDLVRSDESWRVAILRYFNPVGAHKSGIIGEHPNGIPSNLMPYISQVAVGKLKVVRVYGSNYNTPDGTGVRDYIHVVDLAKGHISAMKALEICPQTITVNLGTGTGYSVLELISAFQKASKINIPYSIEGRRQGDVASCYADPTYAAEKIGWRAEIGLDEMCEDVWRWQSQNPDGYDST